VRQPPVLPSFAPSQEQQWLAGLRAGQVTAFDAVYTAIVPSLYIFAQRFVPADLAEDVVQDVMVDLWERRATLTVSGSLRGYLFGAVRRRIADHQRHEGVVQRVAEAALDGRGPLPAVGTGPSPPDEAAVANELQTAIDAALAQLPARARLILALRWFDGLSYPEIAEALDMSVEAAKKQGRRMELVVRPLLARFTPS
jgi:RNA polymerase sigma-70 factor (ECF subfamily)